MVTSKADVRHYEQLAAAVETGVEEFGRIDIIIANAGIVRMGPDSEDFLADWNDVIDTNLTGVYHTVRAALPTMRAGGRGGSVNTIHPTGVSSELPCPDAMNALMEQAAAGGQNSISGMQNALPLPILQPEDIANAVAFLVSDQANFITGIQWPLDAGFTVR
jgi:NAD(P)-dependent dehydrogenase (short-subunit alcohol dehydrogenase family)